jgi:trigger factor
MNEEFIKKVSKDRFTTEEELRKDIEKGIQSYYDQRKDEILRDKLIKVIVKNNDFAPPATLVSNLLEDMIKREEEESKKHGRKNINKDTLKNYLAPFAESEVKWYLIKNSIQKKESISADENELKELAEKESEKTSLPVDKLLKFYEASNYREKLADKKLFEFLKEKNNIMAIDPEKISKKETEE